MSQRPGLNGSGERRAGERVKRTRSMVRDAKPQSREAQPENGQRRRRGEVQDLVLAKLRHGLMIGAFVSGQKITLRRLAEALGTSPMPVRKAINQLAAANVLETLPNRSVAVPRMSTERFKELTKVRQAVEGLAAELACASATPELLRELRRINADLLQSIERRRVLELLELNQRFHFTLYGENRSSVLFPLIESLWLQAGPIMYFSLSSPEMPWDAAAHEDVLKAIEQRRPADARRAIVRDIERTAKSLLRLSLFDEDRELLGGIRDLV